MSFGMESKIKKGGVIIIKKDLKFLKTTNYFLELEYEKLYSIIEQRLFNGSLIVKNGDEDFSIFTVEFQPNIYGINAYDYKITCERIIKEKVYKINRYLSFPFNNKKDFYDELKYIEEEINKERLKDEKNKE